LLFEAAFSAINLPFTVLLILVLLYWMSVILGALDISLFDFDIDTSVEPSGLQGFLLFLSAGEVPFMLIVSIMSLSMWSMAILSNYYLGNTTSWLIAAGLAVPNFGISIFVTKFAVKPFSKLFKALHYEGDHVSAIGSLCVLHSDATEERIAQATVKTGSAPLTLMVRTRAGEALTGGSQALVIEKDAERDLYIVEPFQDWES